MQPLTGLCVGALASGPWGERTSSGHPPLLPPLSVVYPQLDYGYRAGGLEALGLNMCGCHPTDSGMNLMKYQPTSEAVDLIPYVLQFYSLYFQLWLKIFLN